MIVYFIVPGDTLQSIASQINLENPLYLKEYHNRHCAREDYIEEELIPRKKLLLPDFFDVQQYNSNNDAPFKSPDRNPTVNFMPENSDESYKVRIAESSTDKHGKTATNSFSYTISLKWVKKELNNHSFLLFKGNFSNIKETKMGDLAIACIQSVNPVEIHVDSKGEILKINLLEKTVDSFSVMREKLIDQFPDQYARIYIDEFEYVVNNEELFQRKMKEDGFVKAYFAPFRKEFKNGKSYFKIYSEEENSWLNIQQEGWTLQNNDEIILKQSSFENGDHNTSNYSGNYTLSKQNGMIRSLNIVSRYEEHGVIHSTELFIDKNY